MDVSKGVAIEGLLSLRNGAVVSKGVGFRYLIAKRYGFAMGADIARGPEETAFYIQAGSAW
jgi:hypothetical protein